MFRQPWFKSLTEYVLLVEDRIKRTGWEWNSTVNSLLTFQPSKSAVLKTPSVWAGGSHRSDDWANIFGLLWHSNEHIWQSCKTDPQKDGDWRIYIGEKVKPTRPWGWGWPYHRVYMDWKGSLVWSSTEVYKANAPQLEFCGAVLRQRDWLRNGPAGKMLKRPLSSSPFVHSSQHLYHQSQLNLSCF